MAQVINTNSLSLMTQNNMNASQSSLNTAIQRLSSGLRINSAKDDAAGQAIANRFTANIKGLTQATRNANDGISIAQTTEGALTEVNNNLQRIRELSVQAANGTNSASDLDSIQAEITQRLDEINRVSEQTQFNGVKVLSADAGKLTIQVGANDGQTIDIDLKEISAKTLGLDGFNVNGKGTINNEKANLNDLTKAGATGAANTVTTSNQALTAKEAISKLQDGNTVTLGTGGKVYTYDAASGNFTSPTTTLAADIDDLAASQLPLAGTTTSATYTTGAGSTTFEVDSTGNVTIGGAQAYLTATNELTTNVADATTTAADLEMVMTAAGVEGATASVAIGGVTYKGNATAGLDYSSTFSKDVVEAALSADAAGGTIAMGSGVYAHTATFAAAGGKSSDTYVDSDGEMTSTANYTTTYDVDPLNGEVTVSGGSGTGKYAPKVGAVVYVDANGGGLTTSATSKGELTEDPLASIDAALSKVDELRGSLGAVQNRFDSAIANLGTTISNLSSSRSRIQDADYAVEVSNMTRAQILQQAGTSVLAQANQTTQGVLSLLR